MATTARSIDVGPDNETDQSRQVRENRERQLAYHQMVAEKQDHWNSLESGRKARVEALALVMSGKKPPKRVEVRVEYRRLGRLAKAALKDYVAWAREHKEELTEEQRSELSDLITAWKVVKVAGPEDESGQPAMPKHADLKTAHEALAKTGVGNFQVWGRYMRHVRVLLGATDAAGAPVNSSELPPPPQKEEDETYADDRSFVSIDELNEIMQKQFSEKKERDAREKEEKRRLEAEKHFAAEAHKAAQKRAQRAEVEIEEIDDDGFIVSKTTTAALDQKPAGLDAYSWTDDEERLVVYIELSKPVRSQDLTVEIGATKIRVLHLGKSVLQREWERPVKNFHDETLWFLEGAGDVLRLEVVKEPPQMGPGFEAWPRLFEADAYGQGRGTRTDHENFSWRQTQDEVTVTFDLARGTTKHDVSVIIRRDALRVYVKGMGPLVDGVVNRGVNVKDSTWTLVGRELCVVLAKLEKEQAWQRLMVGGNEITIQAAWMQMGEEPPAGDSAKTFEELPEADQLYVRTLRELEYARAAGDDDLVEEIQADLDACQVSLNTDVDRPHREQLKEVL